MEKHFSKSLLSWFLRLLKILANVWNYQNNMMTYKTFLLHSFIPHQEFYESRYSGWQDRVKTYKSR